MIEAYKKAFKTPNFRKTQYFVLYLCTYINLKRIYHETNLINSSSRMPIYK